MRATLLMPCHANMAMLPCKDDIAFARYASDAAERCALIISATTPLLLFTPLPLFSALIRFYAADDALFY